MINYRWLLLPLLALAGSVNAGPPYITQLLSGNGGLGVAAQNEWLVVGNPDPSACSVFVYKLDYSTMLYGDGSEDGEGLEFQTLIAPGGNGNCDNVANRGFGEVATVDGDLMLVGAPLAKGAVSVNNFPGDDPNDPSDPVANAAGGAVFIYEYDGISWMPAEVESLEVIYASEEDLLDADGSEYGSALSLDGDLIAVGARFDGVKNGSKPGKVYLYRWSGSGAALTVIPLATTPAVSGQIDGDAFGTSVTVWVEDTDVGSGVEQILVGAPSNDPDDDGDPDGAVYLYTVTGEDAGSPEKVFVAENDFAAPSVGVGQEVSLGADLGLMSGESSYPLERTGGMIQPKFQYERSDGGDVSQSVGVAAFGVNGEGVDIYPDVLNDNGSQRANYHLEIAATGASRGTAEDIRLYKDIVAVNDNPADQVQVFHFPSNYGGKLLADEWDLVTAPGNLPEGTTVEQAFNADVFSDPNSPCTEDCGVLGLYGSNWWVWGQDWGDPAFDYTIAQTTSLYNATDAIEPGKGYWIKSDGIRKPGQPVYWNVDDSTWPPMMPEDALLVLDTDNPFVLGAPLPEGVGAYYELNLPDNIPAAVVNADVMLGNPFGRGFKWSDVGVVLLNGATPITIPVSDLGVGTYLNTTLVAYRYVPDPGAGQLYEVVSSTPGLDDVVPVNEGFFVVVNQGVGLTFDKLLLPFNK